MSVFRWCHKSDVRFYSKEIKNNLLNLNGNAASFHQHYLLESNKIKSNWLSKLFRVNRFNSKNLILFPSTPHIRLKKVNCSTKKTASFAPQRAVVFIHCNFHAFYAITENYHC